MRHNEDYPVFAFQFVSNPSSLEVLVPLKRISRNKILLWFTGDEKKVKKHNMVCVCPEGGGS